MSIALLFFSKLWGATFCFVYCGIFYRNLSVCLSVWHSPAKGPLSSFVQLLQKLTNLNNQPVETDCTCFVNICCLLQAMRTWGGSETTTQGADCQTSTAYSALRASAQGQLILQLDFFHFKLNVDFCLCYCNVRKKVKACRRCLAVFCDSRRFRRQSHFSATVWTGL